MKKKIIFFLVLFFLFGIISVASSQNNKIDSKILKKFEKGSSKVRVIVDISEKNNKGIFSYFLNKPKTRDELINYIGKEKIKHKLSNTSFSAELSKEEMQNLINQGYSVNYDWPMKLYLQDTAGIINATSTWKLKESGLNLTGLYETVCILDTGVNFTHPDLIGRNLTCNIDCIGGSCSENCSVSDDNGHGTHIAGIIAANSGLTGIAFNSDLISVKVLNSAGEGFSGNVLAGLQWCINNANTYNISVISMSLGCNETPSGYSTYCDSSNTSAGCARKYFTTEINNAFSHNISVVIATGNNAWKNAISAPACIQNSIRVGSSTKDDSISSFSNRWNLSMFLAPGSFINSTRWNPTENLTGCTEQGDYMTCSGTSMAVPHVVGAIAIINQFLKLTHQIKNPFEIKQVLNNTAKRIKSSSNPNLTYPRIDLYSAIISFDNLKPIINLSYPLNNTKSSLINQTFICNASDLSLQNITLYIWNSTGIYNITSESASGAYHVLMQNLTNMPYSNYSWNCLVYDENGNYAWQNYNNTLLITPKLINIISPINNSWLNTGNFSLILNEEGSCVFSLNNHANISMNTTDNKTFYYINNTLNNTSSPKDYNITYYCKDTRGNNHSSSLIYFGFEDTKPIITLISPTNSYSQKVSSIILNFTFNVSDNLNISSCELIINGTSNSITLNTSIINKSANNIISKELNSGTYSWKINCTDIAGNENSSDYRNFVLIAPSHSSSSSRSSGGGKSSSHTILNTVIIINKSSPKKEISSQKKIPNPIFKNQSLKKIIFLKNQTLQSYTLKEEDTIKFNLSKTPHTLKIRKIKNNSVDLTIQSNLINLTLFKGSEKKINLTSPDYYDLYIKLNNITNNQVNLSIKKINEKINFSINKKLLISFFILIIIYFLIKIINKENNETTKTKSKREKKISSDKK